MTGEKYMEGVRPLPLSQGHEWVAPVLYILLIFELFAIALNIITFFLIRKQGFKTVDMWIAAVLTVGDTIYLIYKIIQSTLVSIYGAEAILTKSNIYVQFDGAFETFVLLTSINCMGILAAIRFWGLYLKKPIISKYWVLIFTVEEMFILVGLIVAAAYNEFVLAPGQLYNCIYSISTLGITKFVITLQIFYFLLNWAIINISYPLLCKGYLEQLRYYDVEQAANLYSMKRFSNGKKTRLIAKTVILLFLYNLCMVPSIIIFFKEQITETFRSYEEDFIFSCPLFLVALVNPLTLLVLHDNTTKIFKTSLASFINSIKSYISK